MEKAIFAGGCFWCTEAIFQRLKGVESIFPGYTGGTIKNPAYREICTGRTGHAEAIEITFNKEEVSFNTLLEVFFASHDPTTLNRQGADVGTQYRSGVFYTSEEQKKQIREEEIYREEIVKSLGTSTKDAGRKSLWKLLNSAIFIWLLSTVVVGIGTYLFKQLEIQAANRDTVNKIDLEISSRLFNFYYQTLADVSEEEAILILEAPTKSNFPSGIFQEYSTRSFRGLLWELKTLIPNDNLEIEIRNSGQYIFENNQAEEGLGIKNTLQRLKLLYGEAATFNIENESEYFVLTKITIPQIQ